MNSPDEHDGVLIAAAVAEEETVVTARPVSSKLAPNTVRIDVDTVTEKNLASPDVLHYIFLPLLFLTVALLGGLRLMTPDNAFSFWWPPLFCLIAAAMLLALFAKSGLIAVGKWFSERFGALGNAANGTLLLTVFVATAQVFNALIPERGIWSIVVSFCFFWTLVTNFFGNFDARGFLRLTGATCAVAFIFKYLVLAGLTAPAGKGLLESLTDGVLAEVSTRLFGLERFAPATGYIQFFTVGLYLVGLMLLPSRPSRTDD